MKIRKQVQKQAEEGALEEKKFGRQVVSTLETEIITGGARLLTLGDCRPTRGGGGALTKQQQEEEEEGGGGHLELEVLVAAPRVEDIQTTTKSTTTVVHHHECSREEEGEEEEESNSGSCGDWTLNQDDINNNPKRKYARRSLRSAGAQVQANAFSNGPTQAKANILQRRSRGECRRPGGHPSEEPEGSLLHCLYLQLVAAGNEGMTLKEIFASFASQTRFSSLGSNWREQVKSHLTGGNPHFKAVKSRHFLLEQLQPPPSSKAAPPHQQQPPKAAAARHQLVDLNVPPLSRASSRRRHSGDSSSDPQISASPDPSVVNVNIDHREGVQTRRKTYERTIEAVLNESAVEFQKTQKLEEIDRDTRSTDEFSTASRRSSDVMNHHHMGVDVVTPPESATAIGDRPKRKSMDTTTPEDLIIRHNGAVPGSLKAMQARIVAETGVNSGVRCSRKDGSNHHSKWQCPMMAMEGRSLCQHHNFLSERKKARYKKAKHQAAGMLWKESRKSTKSPVMPQLQDLNKPPRSDSMDEDEEDEDLSFEEFSDADTPTHRLVRTRSDARDTNGSLAESVINNNVAQITTDDMDSETEPGSGGQQLDLLPPKSRSVNNPLPSSDHHHHQIQQLGRQSCRSTRKPRLYLAAKKTAAEKTPVVAPLPGKSVKKQSVPLIRPPSIPPLPMLYGVRRKAMKTRPSPTF